MKKDIKKEGEILKNTPSKFNLDILNDMESVASDTEYTGLYPTPPENEWEEESYEDIYDMPKVQKNK